MIATTEVRGRHSIPGCAYSIHASTIEDLNEGRPAGLPIVFARIGDRVLHQWHCDDEMFGILIKNCYVADGFGSRADVIDDRGCVVDPILINGIHYTPDLQRAYAESQVFKFADKPGVWFFCQIQMCMKKEGMCKGVTPPTCTSSGLSPYNQKSQVTGTTSRKDVIKGEMNIIKGEMTSLQPFKIISNTSSSPHINIDEGKKYTEGSKIRSENGLLEPNSFATFSQDAASFASSLESQLGFSNTNSSKQFRHVGGGMKNGNEQTLVSATRINSEKQTASSQIIQPLKHAGSLNDVVSEINVDEEVIVPEQLQTLLSNLPEKVSEDSLRKMFHESINDRRALIEGINLIGKQTNEYSKRMADAPPSRSFHSDRSNSSTAENLGHSTPSNSPLVHEEPMIAAQLLIYELDEEPPNSSRNVSEKRDGRTVIDCMVNHKILSVFVAIFGVISVLLFTVSLALMIRIRRHHLHREITGQKYWIQTMGTGREQR
ncbi:hypothetical protein AB6A40_008107 [Gnathostoma spinigerum]|uniref:ZP domain-containing protein n=1 Tax=Gnathostoma spinigerum TaxID=75299 RepID=A0ABD6EN63_9BILA